MDTPEGTVDPVEVVAAEVEAGVESPAEANYLSMSDAEIANISPSTMEEIPTTTLDNNVDQDNIIDSTTETTKEVVESNIDYKQNYEELFKPFKANGKEIQISSVEDARTLMQMGANYNKKMAALKPNLKIMKMLENNGLLDETKLNFLIDLDKKDPNAIARLVSESGVDPLDIDENKAKEYTPRTYTVSDAEEALDAVLSEIKESPSYTTTLDVVNNKWDAASRKVLLKQPDGIRVINAHIENGVYDKIMYVVEQERMMGRLNDMADLDAYKHVGKILNDSGHLDTPAKPVVKAPSTTTVKQQDTLARKLAAASPKSANKAKESLPDGFNALALSDADFEKYASQYLYK